jgi:hypothetical protein
MFWPFLNKNEIKQLFLCKKIINYHIMNNFIQKLKYIHKFMQKISLFIMEDSTTTVIILLAFIINNLFFEKVAKVIEGILIIFKHINFFHLKW